MIQHVIRYIERGWSVVPLIPRTKRPAVKLAPYLSGETRLSVEAAREYWDENPDAGIAIVTGAPSGVVVVDVDPRNGGDAEAVAKEVVTDCIALTGGGGVHFFCAHPGGMVPCGKTNRVGVDRKGDGGYVVAPPSIHPSGSAYAWATEGTPGPLPAWALEYAPTAAGPIEDRGPWVASTLARPDLVPPGAQEETLTRLCWWAAGNMPYDIALSTLCLWVGGLELSRPEDPWTAEHVADRLDRAVKNRQPSPVTVNLVAARAQQTSAPVTNCRPLLELALTASEREDKAMSEPPQPWIIEDFIAPGTWTEIIGRMKEGKSTFVYAMLRAVLAGDTFLGRETKRTKALLLTEQTGMSLRATLERADLVRADDLSILTVSDIHGHTWPEVVAAATIIAKNRGAGIIVVDTLARLAQIADEDEARSVNVLYPFVAAKALGIATVFVRHSRKSGGPLNVAARGSGAITGEMDICVGITAPQGPSSDYRNVELISRLTGMDELHLDYNDGDFTLLAEPPKRGSKKPNRILDALSAAPMQTQSVTELLQKTGMKNRTLFYHLKLLRDSGAIRQVEQSSGRERSYTLNPAAAVIVDAATKGQDD